MNRCGLVGPRQSLRKTVPGTASGETPRGVNPNTTLGVRISCVPSHLSLIPLVLPDLPLQVYPALGGGLRGIWEIFGGGGQYSS